MSIPIKTLFQKDKKIIYILLLIVISITIAGFISYQYLKLKETNNRITILSKSELTLLQRSKILDKKLKAILSEDQYVKNKKQEAEIKHIHDTYKKTVETYESLLKLQDAGGNNDKLNEKIADALTLLADMNYSSAEAVLNELNTGIKQENDTLAKKAAAFTIPQNIVSNNTPPASGYSRQKVTSDVGDFLVDIISADLGSTRVIVDTASDNDCNDNCPVLPLSDYISRNGAYAGINGTYFCPSTYPSCAGKANSFDLLVMNKNKHYFNSDNNVYSKNPVVIFGSGWVRFEAQGSSWGRDTGVDGVLMNYPLLVLGKQITFGGNEDPKMGSKGPRGFIANKGNTVYIGFISNATMAEAAHVLKSMDMDNAMNLDEGGSTALWSGGYIMGPGRNIPNAIMFIKK